VIISKIIDNVKGYVYSLKLNIIFWNHYQSARDGGLCVFLQLLF